MQKGLKVIPFEGLSDVRLAQSDFSFQANDDDVYTANDDGKGTCHICNVTFTSILSAKSHLEGEKHMAREKINKHLKVTNQTTALVRCLYGRSILEDMRCEICNVKSTSVKDYETHMAGSKHHKVAKSLKIIEELDIHKSTHEHKKCVFTVI